jgi:hypothetical protein
MPANPNAAAIEIATQGLRRLLERIVFVDGATVAFYITDEGAPPIRSTDDIDCIIEVHSSVAYHDLEQS